MSIPFGAYYLYVALAVLNSRFPTAIDQLTVLFSLFQPLMDNLDSFTYEMFEKDPIKYTEYEKVLFNSSLL